MSARCLNVVMLIGNLTRDPELRYTPTGAAVCSFGMATNRSWTTQDGQRKDEASFHKINVWGVQGEFCSKALRKGSKAFVQGRLQYREWTGNDGVKRQTTEVVAEDVIALDPRRDDFGGATYGAGGQGPQSHQGAPADDTYGMPSTPAPATDDNVVATADDTTQQTTPAAETPETITETPAAAEATETTESSEEKPDEEKKEEEKTETEEKAEVEEKTEDDKEETKDVPF